MNNNTENIKIASEKLYKMTLSANRDEMNEQGAFDGRFSTKVGPDKKKGEYLKIRKEKHKYKSL
jgi:hypothetical protein